MAVDASYVSGTPFFASAMVEDQMFIAAMGFPSFPVIGQWNTFERLPDGRLTPLETITFKPVFRTEDVSQVPLPAGLQPLLAGLGGLALLPRPSAARKS